MSLTTNWDPPAVLSREGVLSLFAFLEERLRSNALRAEFLLLSQLPWTEYTLYYTYLEHTGLFDRYHVPARSKIYGNNIWRGQDPAAWNPAKSFAARRAPWFSVLQGHTVHDVDAIVAKIRAYFASIDHPSPF